MPFPKFDRSRLAFKKLTGRKNRIFIETDHIPVTFKPLNLSEKGLELVKKTTDRIKIAIQNRASVMLVFGAHTIKNGMAPVLISLMEEGWITHLATNGAGIIHDWEFAFQGKSGEDVRENVRLGQFGIWEETGFFINLALITGAYERLGYGESIGKMISQEGLEIPELSHLYKEAEKNMHSSPHVAAAALDFAGAIREYRLEEGFMVIPHPWKKYSAQARAFELRIPFTGHPMIGHDIIYTHPLNSGAAVGRTALNDFLAFTESVSNIDNGVYMSVVSAVMSPMIFEKSFSMARNIKNNEKKNIDNHYMIIVDMAATSWDWKKNGEPPENNPDYYLRYCKTFNRMGGEMHYLTADNRDFLLALYQNLNKVRK